jgi:DNA repair exonuclease SbcCD ATPase subunit
MQLSAADRRAIIEDLLDIQIFSVMNSLVKSKLSSNKDEMVQKKNEIELLKQKYDLKKEHLDKLNQNNEEKVKEYDGEIQSNRETIGTLSDEIDILVERLSSLDDTVAKAPEIENKIASYKKVESQIESKISKVRNDTQFYEHNADCPTCRQAITVEFKETLCSELSSKEHELNEALKELQAKITAHESILKVVRNDEKERSNVRIELATTQTLIKGYNENIIRLEKEIKNLQTNNDSVDQSELVNLQNEIKETQSELRQLLTDKTYYDAASLLLKDTGIKTKIIKQYLPIINKLVNKYLSSLNFFVNFNLDESFKETIKSRHRDDFSYHNFSEGEKQRIDMALMLTWRAVAKLKNSANTNLLILDETFDSSLDVGGTEELMKILHMLEGVNLFVISHKGDILQDKFITAIRFAKEKNFSKVMR